MLRLAVVAMSQFFPYPHSTVGPPPPNFSQVYPSMCIRHGSLLQKKLPCANRKPDYDLDRFNFRPDSRATSVCKCCLQLFLPCATSLRFQSPAFLLRFGNGNACNACWGVPVEDARCFFGYARWWTPLSCFCYQHVTNGS